MKRLAISFRAAQLAVTALALCLFVFIQPVKAACISEPLMQGQDPQVEMKNGVFYLVQSDGCNIKLRQSATMGGLATAADQYILSPGCSNLWAPEIHWFSNKWYLYYSLGNPDHPNHRVYVAQSQGASATGPYSILGILYDGYWNIDGSVFAATNGQLYFIFSGSPSGSQQNIYIAPMSNPYTVSGAPVLISQPTLSWETIGTPPSVNEGPFGFTHNGRTFIDYSASGCWTDSYCLGLLTLTGTNLLDPAAWTKSGPVFSQQPGAYGPGHNGIFTDANGQYWNIYHANNLAGQGCGGYRQLRIQRLAWDANNLPVFGVPVPTNSLVIDDTNFLAAQYPLTASSGTNAVTTTCGPAGVFFGAPVWQNPGLKFNGTNDYVDCGSALGNDVQNTLTLAAWIKADAFVDWAAIIAKGINTEPYAMQIWHDGSLRFSANWGSPGGGVGGGSWNSNCKMLANQWYHVAITYDGATIRFYTNGVLDTYQPAATLRFGVVNESMTLAADLPGGHEYFSGTIRDARVYGRALSALEISAAAGLPVTPTGFSATAGTNQVRLSWNAVAGASNYVVQRALDSAGPYTIIANTSAATNFTDTVVTYGMTYYYAVASMIATNRSAFTAPAGAVPLSPYPLPTGLSFAKGADVGWVTEMEASGYRWQNRDGTQQDIFQILTNLGLNAIRLRVWVNPAAGWNNKADVIAKAVRAKNVGLRVMIDFHYSDTWADPGHQTKPAAWTNYSTAQLVAAVSNHTTDVMSGLQSAGVGVEWAQVGNEITCGMLWPDGFTCGTTNNETNLVAMINSGYTAIKALSPATRVVVHLNNGQGNYRWWFDPAVNLGVQFDVIGLSVYPATTTNWLADTTAALANMVDISARYGKEVVVAETGMDASAAQACQNMLVDLMNKTRSVPNGKGIGLFYWEPEAYAFWGQSAWSSTTTRPTIAMDAFAYEPNQPPGSPALTGSNQSAQVQLNWTVPVGAATYRLKRATIRGGPYALIATPAGTSFTDTNLAGGTPYFYVVSAVNAFGEGANSSEISAIVGTNHAPVFALLPSQNIGAGQTLLVTNLATDPEAPPQMLAFSLLAGPAGATVNASNGICAWRPKVADAGSTNTFAVVVTDNGSPNLSATQSFQVVVASLAKPLLDSYSISNSVFTVRVNGDSGPDYTIQTATNLAQTNAWFSAFTTNSPGLPFFWTDFGAATNPAQYYRLLLSP